MKPTLWLPRIDFRPQVRLRLVCFAHAGGGAAPFLRWAPLMPEGVALCPVRRPGREAALGEPLLRDVMSIADGAYTALATLPPRPTLLLGHSLGAAVAFEVARRMQAAQQPPVGLIVSAKPPVHHASTRPRIATLPDAQFIDALDTTYGGIPPAVRAEPELLAMMLPMLRADLQSSEGYQATPTPRLTCPIHVCYGIDDRAVSSSTMPAWGELTTAALTVEPYPGGHFYLFDAPAFCENLRARLHGLLA